MKIYNITPINFAARKPVAANTVNQVNVSFTKDNFYDQIEGFLNNQYTKEKYLKMFSDGVDKIVKQQSISKYSPTERKYINNLVSLIDLSENLKNIPDEYLKKNMQELLAHKV